MNAVKNDHLSDWHKKPILVLGCGNRLFGDDGFGPAVVEALLSEPPPEDVYVMDVGTGAREVLFPMLLGETMVRKIIIIDAVDIGRVPGEIFELQLDRMPALKTDDFSMHQAPSSNILRELRDQRKINVTVCACQIKNVPDDVAPGLSGPVRAAIPRMCALVAQHWR